MAKIKTIEMKDGIVKIIDEFEQETKERDEKTKKFEEEYQDLISQLECKEVNVDELELDEKDKGNLFDPDYVRSKIQTLDTSRTTLEYNIIKASQNLSEGWRSKLDKETADTINKFREKRLKTNLQIKIYEGIYKNILLRSIGKEPEGGMINDPSLDDSTKKRLNGIINDLMDQGLEYKKLAESRWPKWITGVIAAGAIVIGASMGYAIMPEKTIEKKVEVVREIELPAQIVYKDKRVEVPVPGPERIIKVPGETITRMVTSPPTIVYVDKKIEVPVETIIEVPVTEYLGIKSIAPIIRMTQETGKDGKIKVKAEVETLNLEYEDGQKRTITTETREEIEIEPTRETIEKIVEKEIVLYKQMPKRIGEITSKDYFTREIRVNENGTLMFRGKPYTGTGVEINISEDELTSVIRIMGSMPVIARGVDAINKKHTQLTPEVYKGLMGMFENRELRKGKELSITISPVYLNGTLLEESGKVYSLVTFNSNQPLDDRGNYGFNKLTMMMLPNLNERVRRKAGEFNREISESQGPNNQRIFENQKPNFTPEYETQKRDLKDFAKEAINKARYTSE